ncbi:MAG: Clp protease N-terminal domain-containing protein [Caldilineaceae bacterium]
MEQLPPNLTQPARYVLEMAREITPAGSSTQTEHILYALLQIPGSDTRKIIDSLGANSQQLLEIVRSRVRNGLTDANNTEWSPAAAQVIAQASTLAFQQRSKEIATRHLLLALMSIENPMRSLLFDNGVSLAKLQDLRESLNATTPKTQAASPTSVRGAIQVSGVFWGLLLATAICGYLTWSPAIPNKSFALFLFVTLGWIVSLCLHEFGHAFTAYLFGDDSVYFRGYLTLNPLRYTDPFISIVMPLIFLLMGGLGLPGGAVYVDRSRIQAGWRHSMISLAGPLANAIVVVILWLVLMILPISIQRQHAEFWAGISFLLFLEMTAILFNLIPLPPLDGFNILAPYLPPSMQGLVFALRRWGFFILMMLFWVNNPIIQGFWMMVIRIMVAMQIDVGYALWGYELYRFWIPGSSS